MKSRIRLSIVSVILACLVGIDAPAGMAFAESGAGLRDDAAAALASLYRQTPSAKILGDKAKAVLIFPNIVEAGFLVGGRYGQGIRRDHGKMTGYYNSVGASYGLQAGAQGFGYVLFLMTDSAVRYLNRSRGWEVGVGPSVVVIDEGVARSLSTTTLHNDVYAFVFNQKGLMAGISVQGSKITRITP